MTTESSTHIEQEGIEDLPSINKRKRRAQHQSGYVQVDSFVVTKKPKATTKKEVEEEFATTWICVECKEAECMMEPDATELLICDGVCRRVFHYPCAGLSRLPPENVPFLCPDCIHRKHMCSLCSNYGHDNDDVYKCSRSNCGLFFHEACLAMINVDFTIVTRNMKHEHEDQSNQNHNADSVVGNDDNDDDEIDDIDGALSDKDTTQRQASERRFVCPAHSCWTCTQTDLKERHQEVDDLVDDNNRKSGRGRKKSTKRKKNVGVFEAKKEKFLTVRLSWM
jgi:hypothetical protein